MKWIGKLFGGGFTQSIERIALEAIDTDMESAEAKALWIKTLDPNGAMRRELSRFACRAYGFYLVVTVSMVVLSNFAGAETAASATAASKQLADLFVPITTAWGTMVTASFGVNATNVIRGKPPQ